jgi:multiple antibiotic resistance protein
MSITFYLDCFVPRNDAKRQKKSTMFSQINFVEIFGAFIVMAAIIDIFGSIPIFVSMKEQNKTIKAGQACLTALGLFLAFFFAGDALLKMFGIDAASFAVAGSFVLFILAVEMILGREIIKNDGGTSGASIVPIAFPLIAGPGALTALLSLRADYAVINIMIALLLNILLDYVVIRSLDKVQRLLGPNLIFILRKFFGVILLAIAVNMFVNNISVIIASVQK